jgi:hypothetical protein
VCGTEAPEDRPLNTDESEVDDEGFDFDYEEYDPYDIDLYSDYSSLQRTNRKWGLFTLLGLIGSTSELAYLEEEICERKRIEYEAMDVVTKSRYDGRDGGRHWRDNNSYEDTWEAVLASQWMFWSNNFMFWGLYNVGVKAYPLQRLVAGTFPFFGALITLGYLSCYDDEEEEEYMEEWGSAVTFHSLMTINMWMERSAYMEFIEVDEQLNKLEFVEDDEE